MDLNSSSTMDDRISNLPDALIFHILSFLPTKEAFATSVLSKLWIPLWRSVSTLDFESYNQRKEASNRFVQGVNAVIDSRDLHQPILKFRLRFILLKDKNEDEDDATSITKWVNTVVQCGVQHVDLSIRYTTTANLSAIFTCSTLVVLKLEWLKLKPFPPVDLPLLKVLHLQTLNFTVHRCLAHLLSGCPVLEDFKASGIYFDSHSTVSDFKTLLKLARADISMQNTRFLLMEVVNNVEFLRIHEMEYMHQRYDDAGTYPYIFTKFHNLTHIELVYHNGIKDWLKLVELLKYCSKLQVLVINQSHFRRPKFGPFEEPEDLQHPPSVPECILSHLETCYLNGYRGTQAEFRFAKYIMQNGSFLKRMTISMDIVENQQRKRKRKMLKKLSSCTRLSATCKLYFK